MQYFEIVSWYALFSKCFSFYKRQIIFYYICEICSNSLRFVMVHLQEHKYWHSCRFFLYMYLKMDMNFTKVTLISKCFTCASVLNRDLHLMFSRNSRWRELINKVSVWVPRHYHLIFCYNLNCYKPFKNSECVIKWLFSLVFTPSPGKPFSIKKKQWNK